jgi:hypothetical protein
MLCAAWLVSGLLADSFSPQCFSAAGSPDLDDHLASARPAVMAPSGWLVGYI